MDDIVDWLQTRSGEDVVALVARSSLRALPSLSAGLGRSAEPRAMSDDDFASHVVLPTFRAAAAPWVAMRHRKIRARVQANAALAAANADTAATAAKMSKSRGAKGSYAAADAAHSVANIISSIDDQPGTPITPRVSIGHRYAAYSMANKAVLGALQSAEADAVSLEHGCSALDLLSSPLRGGATLQGTSRAWSNLKRELISRDENWQVWTEWYEARRDGSPPEPSAVEMARLFLEAEFWSSGPRILNGELLRLIELGSGDRRRRARQAPADRGAGVLAQRHSSFVFDRQNGLIEATIVSESPFDSELAQTIAQELRDKAAGLLSTLTGNHADEAVSRDVQRALDLFSDPVDRIAEGLLLMRANSVAAHARAYADAGHERERSIRSALDDFSESLNALTACYPGIRLIAANRLELEVQLGGASAIATQLDVIADQAQASTVVASSASLALAVGRDEQGELDAKIAASDGETRGAYLADHSARVAARLLDATNFVSAAAQAVAAEVGGLGVDTWRAVRATLPARVAQGLADGAEGSLRTAAMVPAVYALLLMHQIGMPWEAIAMLVPRLRPHARKVRKIMTETEAKRTPPADP